MNELEQYLKDKKQKQNLIPFYITHKQIKHPKILLINPCMTIPKNMMKRCLPPLGISYIASNLEKNRIEVDMFDCCVEGWHIERKKDNLITYGLPPNKLKEKLKNKQYNIIGISVLFSIDLPNLFEISNEIKNLYPEALIIVGGLHPTIYPTEVFYLDKKQNKKRTIDYIIRGEGEYRLPKFIKQIKEGKLDVNFDGLVGQINKNIFITNPQYEEIEDLDKLPFPAYHLLPMEKYFKINVPFSPVPQGNRVIQITSSRGCPIGCNFCANTNMYKKHRIRSPKNVIKEIKKLKRKYKIDEIQFADDNLIYNQKNAIKLFTLLKKEKLLWCTPNGVMVNKITDELIKVMAESGLYQITLSFDSPDEKTLKEFHHKPVNLKKLPYLINKFRELNIFTHGTSVVGVPGETLESIKKGFDFILNNLQFTSISVFIAAPIPGSKLYHECIENKLINKNEAREVDTTKVKIKLSNINLDKLEKMVADFHIEFMNLIKEKYTNEYNNKYNKLIKKKRLNEKIGGKLT